MLLYDLPAGMHPRRVRIFLAEKQVTLPVRVIDAASGENTTAEFRRMNPMGRLPVLALDDGTVIAESLAICRYLEALYPAPPLWGGDAIESARVDMWTRRMEQQVSNPMSEIFLHAGEFYRNRITQVPEYANWTREQLIRTLAWLDEELADRPFVAGSSYTMADIVAQCAFVLGKAVGVRIPAERPNLARWFTEVSARPTARA
jgi:glutathione S-transferase